MLERLPELLTFSRLLHRLDVFEELREFFRLISQHEELCHVLLAHPKRFCLRK